MESQTDSETEIESIDVANDDLIDVLASLADGDNRRLAVTGEGPYKMAMPTSTSNVVEDTTIYTDQLIEDGEVKDTIDIDGNEAEIQVL